MKDRKLQLYTSLSTTTVSGKDVVQGAWWCREEPGGAGRSLAVQIAAVLTQ
jgi:hypothetical protein